jgi:uncharacterized membrane protein
MRFYVIFSIVAAVVLLVADAFMIPIVMRPLFQSALGETMLSELRLFPALMFYLIHIAGIIWFAGRPAKSGAAISTTALNGAILGFVAYSCYEMTSWTIMRDWHIGLVIIDIGWGTIISGIAAVGGAIAAKRNIDVSQ